VRRSKEGRKGVVKTKEKEKGTFLTK